MVGMWSGPPGDRRLLNAQAEVITPIEGGLDIRFHGVGDHANNMGSISLLSDDGETFTGVGTWTDGETQAIADVVAVASAESTTDLWLDGTWWFCGHDVAYDLQIYIRT